LRKIKGGLLISEMSSKSVDDSTMRRKGEHMKFSSLEEMDAYIQTSGNVEFVDVGFVDAIGKWYHCTYTPQACRLKDLKEGFCFDGSSIPLFTTIDKSDMAMHPVPESCWIDPFCARKTLHVGCYVKDPYGKVFDRCPRGIAQRAAEFMRYEGLADTALMGPEPEFFVFDDVKYEVDVNKASFMVDGEEGSWNNAVTLPKGNLGHRAGLKKYYLASAPHEGMSGLRDDMLAAMAEVGLKTEKHHHEVAMCQHELGIACDDLVTTADNVLTYKYIVKNVAKLHGKTATFMPKPIAIENGSGMHVHQSLSKDNKNLFFDAAGPYFNFSQMAMHYVGGLLKHASSVLAFTNPTVNSYKRLVPGFEAPASLVLSKGNRSAAVRVPLSDLNNPKAKRFEFRCPDSAACPHLAFAAMLMAGIDGILTKVDAPQAIDKDIFELPEEEKAKITSTPASLDGALDALESDHAFLLRGNVFTPDFIKSYIAYKRKEAQMVHLVPTPKEFEMYYHC